MKPAEVRDEYLNIASPRWSRKGEKTPNRNRLVKGRRGVGKFAGLILASRMELETTALGFTTRVEIDKELLLRDAKDLEQVPLPFSTKEAAPALHGTRIVLSRLNPNLNLPQPDRFKQILARDYGRETDFAILVNGERVFAYDVPRHGSNPALRRAFSHHRARTRKHNLDLIPRLLCRRAAPLLQMILPRANGFNWCYPCAG